MGETKPVASLSSGLLARKGHAKPAMRPQGFGGFGGFTAGHDDLGWNDMGHEALRPVSLHNGVHHEEQDFAAPAPVPPPVPLVVRQREELAQELDAVPEEILFVADAPVFEAPVLPIRKKAEPRPVPSVAIARVKKAARGRKGKAAFTLRLDPDRHLKLRLACAIERESAQAIVTEALDRYLASLPELDDLARKVPASAAKHVA